MRRRPTAQGNVLIDGIVGVQKEAVLASKRAIVTVEEIVDDLGPRSFNAVVLPAWTVSAPSRTCRAAPTRPTRRAITRATTPSTRNGTRIARERDSFLAWMKENVLEQGAGDFRGAYPAAAGGGGVIHGATTHPTR